MMFIVASWCESSPLLPDEGLTKHGEAATATEGEGARGMTTEEEEAEKMDLGKRGRVSSLLHVDLSLVEPLGAWGARVVSIVSRQS